MANDEAPGTDTGPVVVLDLDGVVWRGDQPIPGSVEAVAALRDAGVRVAFLTNNSSAPISAVVERLQHLGIAAAPEEVLSSALAAVELLQDTLSPDGRVLACAGPGVVEAVTGCGFTVVDEPPADAVVVGFHRDFDFERLHRASAAVRDGARFVATNRDATYPVAGGVLPGAGALVAAVATAAGREPEVAGKPEDPTVRMVRRHFGPEGVMVGDRPSTDGLLAQRLGWPFALVLSGIGGHDPTEPVPDPPPEVVGADLAAVVPGVLGHLGLTGGAG